jgi:hypothetical protein
MVDYHSYMIEPKRDAPSSIGYVVVKEHCNVMPGATWFRTIEAAKCAVDVLIESAAIPSPSKTTGEEPHHEH